MSVCVYVCLCVCMPLPLRLLITSGMMWCDMDPYDWLSKFYSYYNIMATVVGIVNGHMALALICIMETNLIRVS